jgi:hypothetical protein
MKIVRRKMLRFAGQSHPHIYEGSLRTNRLSKAALVFIFTAMSAVSPVFAQSVSLTGTVTNDIGAAASGSSRVARGNTYP